VQIPFDIQSAMKDAEELDPIVTEKRFSNFTVSNRFISLP
jgi:hypothetical protein